VALNVGNGGFRSRVVTGFRKRKWCYSIPWGLGVKKSPFSVTVVS
jgi:hypothetical protein